MPNLPEVQTAHLQRRPGSTLVNTAFFFCFFPSLLYFAMSGAENQPVAALVVLPLIFMRPLPINKITLPLLVTICVTILYGIVTIFIYPDITAKIILNAGAFIAPMFFFLVMYDKLDLLSPRPFWIALWMWFVMGFAQYLPLPTGLKSPIEDVLRPIITKRFAMTTGPGGRGVEFFASEPSVGAQIILLFALTAVFFYHRGKISRAQLCVVFAITAFMAFFDASGTMVMLIGFLGLGYVLHWMTQLRWRSRLTILAAIPLIIVGGWEAIPPLDNTGSDIRAINVLEMVKAYAPLATSEDVVELMVMVGGQRALQLDMSAYSLLDNHGLGHGIAAWSVPPVIEHVKRMAGVDITDFAELAFEQEKLGEDDKPLSYFAITAFDMGVVGLGLLMWCLIQIIFFEGRIVGPGNGNRLVFVVPAFLWLLQLGVISLIAPWMILAYSLHIARFAPAGQASRRPATMRPVPVHANGPVVTGGRDANIVIS
jgi:hypothetical protein